MLTIEDFNGVDLVVLPPDDVTLLASAATGAKVTVQARIVEDDASLLFDYVRGTLDWHDGSLPVVYNGTGTIIVDTFKNLTPGDYVVSLSGQNFKAPVSDMVQVNYFVTVLAPHIEAEPEKLIFGPILPRDDGFPNSSQWSFDTGFDLNILESSVKMLLLTSKGERVMEPEYGTNLRQIIFEPNAQGIESHIQQEIVEALNRWEPRVELTSLSVVRNTDRSVDVQATFLSKLNQNDFVTTLTFTQ
jgi:Bacteriophage baseplate protein W